jgi:uncharacterized protein YaaQ
MKLIIAIVQDKDANKLTNSLVKEGIQATKLASTGSFLREGNTTFLIGVNENEVEHTLKVVEENCQKRESAEMQGPIINGSGIFPVSVTIGGATIFIMNIEDFKQF